MSPNEEIVCKCGGVIKPIENYFECLNCETCYGNNHPLIIEQSNTSILEGRPGESLYFNNKNKKWEWHFTNPNLAIAGRINCIIDDKDPSYVHPSKGDPINHPEHYNSSKAHCECGRKIECIDITRHLNFDLGNAIKYIWRCDLKGEPIEQLKKALWYLNDEIKKREVKNKETLATANKNIKWNIK